MNPVRAFAPPCGEKIVVNRSIPRGRAFYKRRCEMSKGNCEQIAGRIIGINFEEQAIDIRPYKRPAEIGIVGEPIRLYARNALFKHLVKITKIVWSEYQQETGGHFYIQGRALLHFDSPSRLDIMKAFGEVKYSPEHPK
jgi:hypothetical protein